jgi:hypothetical protein
MSTETRRLTGVGRGIILPARPSPPPVELREERGRRGEGEITDAARRGGERARRRFASPTSHRRSEGGS